MSFGTHRVYGGNLIPSANITNVTGIHILSQSSALITTHFAMRVWRYKWMMCCQQRKQLFFFQVHSHIPEKQQASLQSGNLWKSKASTKGESIPLHHTHPRTCVGLEMMPCDVWWGKFLCFVFCFILFSCLTCKWHLIFCLQVHRLNNYLFRCLEISLFGAVKYFTFISVCVCFVLHCTFDSTTANVLPALELFVFLA